MLPKKIKDNARCIVKNLTLAMCYFTHPEPSKFLLRRRDFKGRKNLNM
uniref:Uncharacterized protein n=1 Tax=Rhizophora mucronata TaxID=61149 RepID=A0A2P2INW0_RHIMU